MRKVVAVLVVLLASVLSTPAQTPTNMSSLEISNKTTPDKTTFAPPRRPSCSTLLGPQFVGSQCVDTTNKILYMCNTVGNTGLCTSWSGVGSAPGSYLYIGTPYDGTYASQREITGFKSFDLDTATCPVSGGCQIGWLEADFTGTSAPINKNQDGLFILTEHGATYNSLSSTGGGGANPSITLGAYNDFNGTAAYSGTTFAAELALSVKNYSHLGNAFGSLNTCQIWNPGVATPATVDQCIGSSATARLIGTDASHRASGTMTTAKAVVGIAGFDVFSKGSITDAIGAQFAVTNLSTDANADGTKDGTITNAYGVNVQAFDAVQSNTTNNYGLYVNGPLNASTNNVTAFFGAPTGTGAKTIYTNGGLVDFTNSNLLAPNIKGPSSISVDVNNDGTTDMTLATTNIQFGNNATNSYYRANGNVIIQADANNDGIGESIYFDPDGDGNNEVYITGNGRFNTLKGATFTSLYTDFTPIGTTPRARICGDYNGDGTLTVSDLQSCIDNLCDTNGDGTQNVVALDLNQDGTAENTNACGDVWFIPGEYVTTSPNYTGLQLKWDGLSVHAYGVTIKEMVPKSKYLTRWGGSATTYNTVQIYNAATSTIQDVTLEGLRVVGVPSMLRSCIDPNADGNNADAVTPANCLGNADNDGTTDGSQNDIVIQNPKRVTVRDCVVDGAYRQGLSVTFVNGTTPEVNSATIENNEWRGEYGEHCAEMDAANLRVINNKFSGCNGILQSGTWAGTQAYLGNRGVEIYASAVTAGRSLNGVVVTGNTFEQTADGVAVILENTTNINIDELTITGNSFRGLLRHGITLNTPSASANIKHVTITGNTYTSAQAGDLYTIPSGQRRGSFVNVSNTTGNLDRVSIVGNTASLYSRGTNSAARTLTQDTVISLVMPSSGQQIANVAQNTLTLFPDWYTGGIDSGIYAAGNGIKIDGNLIHVTNDTGIDYTGDGTLQKPPGIGIQCSACNFFDVTGNTVLLDATAAPPVDYGCINLLSSASYGTISRNHCLSHKSAWGIWNAASGTFSPLLIEGNMTSTYTGAAPDTIAGLYWDNGNTAGTTAIWMRNNTAIGPTGGGAFLNVASSTPIVFEGNTCMKCTTTPEDADQAAGRGWGHMVDASNDGIDAYTLLGLYSKTHLKYGTGSVASASTLNVDTAGDVVTITGSTGITTINTCDTKSAGRPLVILCGAATATFTDGSNLKLNGNFTCTADDSISLMCDGANWIELARSVN